MKNISVVFSDIDGTLLNSNHQVTEKTKDVVKKVILNNTEFVLISARMPSGIKDIYNSLALQSPLVSYNGALILQALDSEKKQSILYSANISQSDAKKIYTITKESFSQISFNLFSHDQWLVEDEREFWTKQESDIIQVIPMEVNINTFINENKDIHKILCMGEPEVISELEVQLRESGVEACWYRSKDTYLEITSKEASKVVSIRELESFFQVKRDQVLAIGDNHNDMSMIEYAGIGIAMGNAPQIVKEAADYVTNSNDEDGLAIALEKFILQNL